ncbi:MAG TPA: hypothetical protein DHV36_00305 [Desulfobacteraceae bacterium]|nr:hypothetical protein [Desulfobacteraceae bacterium]|tara:strand:- start:640 stop:1221 length:582 start_codon:yes stop_codon:yes gene_type:complete
MNVLKELIREHTHILQGIQYLEMARSALENNLSPPAAFFHTAALFFSNYADQLHHFKEEYLLFSLLAAKKGGKIDLEMGALRHQHELNRRSIKKIKSSLNGYEADNEISTTALLEGLAAYISILKRHINREDQFFFPMAESELSDSEKELLHTRFLEEASGSNTKQLIAGNLDRLKEMKKLISNFYSHHDLEN